MLAPEQVVVKFRLFRLSRVDAKTIGRLLGSGACTGSSSLFRWPDNKACWGQPLAMAEQRRGTRTKRSSASPPTPAPTTRVIRMSLNSRRQPLLILHPHQQISRLHLRVPACTSTSATVPAVLGVDGRLHLHRFEREQLLAGCHLLARRRPSRAPPGPASGRRRAVGCRGSALGWGRHLAGQRPVQHQHLARLAVQLEEDHAGCRPRAGRRRSGT